MTSTYASPVRLPHLGLGCSSFWANPLFPETDAHALVVDAIRLGVSYLDTGASYQDGEAERRLGRILAKIDRSPITLSTKAGTRVSPSRKLYKDFSPAWIEQSLHGSLDRLQLDSCDILFLHGPQVSDLSPELIARLETLKAQGKCRAVGVNSFDPAVLEAVLSLPFDGVMLQYNVLDQRADELMHHFREQRKFVIAGTALAQGLYSLRTVNPLRPSGLWYLLRALKNNPRNLLAIRRLAFMHELDGVTAGQAALRFVLDHPAVNCALFGTTSAKHLEENARAADIRMPASVRERLRSAAQA